jgi:hypothetical protein
MAMISLKNLVAPVSNSIHLASIVFVVLVFGVWRWSGGEVNFVRNTRTLTTNNPVERPLPPINRENTEPVKRQQAPTSGEVIIPEEAAEDLLGSILKNKKEPAANRNNQPARDKKSPSSNSLEDIERSLGIR